MIILKNTIIFYYLLLKLMFQLVLYTLIVLQTYMGNNLVSILLVYIHWLYEFILISLFKYNLFL